MNWIDVKEQLPPDFEEVLYFAIIEGKASEIMIGHREIGQWKHCCLFYGSTYLNQHIKVTHCMALPDYPKNDTTNVDNYLNDEKD